MKKNSPSSLFIHLAASYLSATLLSTAIAVPCRLFPTFSAALSIHRIAAELLLAGLVLVSGQAFSITRETPRSVQIAIVDDKALTIPARQLNTGSLQVQADKQFADWSSKDHQQAHLVLKTITQMWKERRESDQYLIYGKVEPQKPFTWEIVPYQNCRTSIGRGVQQLQILWRTIFGGITQTWESQERQYIRDVKGVRALDNADGPTSEATPSPTMECGDDVFCQSSTLDRQWVLRGEKMNVLFSYAPIGFGGDRLHFLVIPQAHRERFTDLTQEEYAESMELTRKLITHFAPDEPQASAHNVYLFSKTGKDAGQTVPHWHLHVIFSTNAAQDVWSKLTVFKNILFGSSRMSDQALRERVQLLRQQLEPLHKDPDHDCEDRL